ncbi:MAG: DUF1697 domain-containing protein [Spirochaetes bacterium]|nr:DUF1697 domain-containing protein [Spirochaetota bacterium]
MERYIALIRGINVGGKTLLSMKELAAVLTELGLEQVRTYLQSGNVVFDAERSNPGALSEAIGAALKERAGVAPSVLVLTQSELAQAVEMCPFPEADDNPRSVHVFFLDREPPDPDLGAIEALAADGERYRLADRFFYFSAPAGFGRSKLAAKAEKLLGVPATARNWRSVRAILDLARG